MEENQVNCPKENQISGTAQLSGSTGHPPGSRIAALLANPLFDKIMAVLAILPFILTAVLFMVMGTMGVVQVAMIVQWLVVAVTFLSRRTAVRITTNPWFWLLAFVATYWLWLTAVITAKGTALIPHWCSVVLALLGLAIAFYARLSLGRNIGLVPAQRRLVTTGAYGLVRHPIYTAIFVNYLAFVLDAYSPGNVLIAVLGVFWYVIKSIVEERFLAADPEYADYMQRVRWRWLPWIV